MFKTGVFLNFPELVVFEIGVLFGKPEIFSGFSVVRKTPGFQAKVFLCNTQAVNGLNCSLPQKAPLWVPPFNGPGSWKFVLPGIMERPAFNSAGNSCFGWVFPPVFFARVPSETPFCLAPSPPIPGVLPSINPGGMQAI